jgi:hypothetical protein
MPTGRFLVIDGDVSITSKRCFSCAHFEGGKSIGNLEKYCSGFVIRVRVPDKGFCDVKRKDVSYDDRCSHWTLDKKIKAYMR